MKKILILFATVCIVSVAFIAIQLNNTQDMRSLLTASSTDEISIRYYGTSTLLFDDGVTQIMIDGFFSRPSIKALFFDRFSPNTERLKHVIEVEQLNRLAVIIPVHSHHDHAMDSAPLAELTGASILGSQTTAYIAEGWGLAQEQITVVQQGANYQYGDFMVRLIPSKHVSMPKFLQQRIGMGEQLDQPLKQPARLSDYKEGVSYSVYIQHPTGNYLVQGSANSVDDVLEGLNADKVFLGIAGLSGKSDDYLQNYLDNTVFAVNARTVIPIHWESFTKTASNQTIPMAIDDIPYSLKRIERLLEAKSIAIKRIDIQSIE